LFEQQHLDLKNTLNKHEITSKENLRPCFLVFDTLISKPHIHFVNKLGDS